MSVPNVIYEYTSRTIQSRFLLRPSALVNSIILGVIGRAQKLYPNVRLFDFVFLSNHFHMLLSSSDGCSCADFMAYVKGNISRELGRAYLHDWKGSLWEGRCKVIPVLDQQALFERFAYYRSHGVKEGLVTRVLDWPGVSATLAHLNSTPLIGLWVNRDRQTKARELRRSARDEDHGTRYEVTVLPYPNMSRKEMRAHCRKTIAEIEKRYVDSRGNGRRRVLGVKSILSQDPHGKPQSSKQAPPPECHASTRLIRKVFREVREAFVAAFRTASRALREGDDAVSFPAFCYPPAGAFVGGRNDALPPWALVSDATAL